MGAQKKDSKTQTPIQALTYHWPSVEVRATMTCILALKQVAPFFHRWCGQEEAAEERAPQPDLALYRGVAVLQDG